MNNDPRELIRAIISALSGARDDEASGSTEIDRAAVGEVRLRSDPSFALPRGAFEMLWSPESGARRKARDLSIQARLDAFADDLKALRTAHRALTRAAILRVVESAEGTIFEIRACGATRRYRLLNREHVKMTEDFIEQLSRIEALRDRLPSPQLADALKQRALEEFTAGINRASKAELAFDKTGLMDLADPEEPEK